MGTLGNPGEKVVAQVADIAASELGWDDDRKQREISELEKAFQLPD